MEWEIYELKSLTLQEYTVEKLPVQFRKSRNEWFPINNYVLLYSYKFKAPGQHANQGLVSGKEKAYWFKSGCPNFYYDGLNELSELL